VATNDMYERMSQVLTTCRLQVLTLSCLHMQPSSYMGDDEEEDDHGQGSHEELYEPRGDDLNSEGGASDLDLEEEEPSPPRPPTGTRRRTPSLARKSSSTGGSSSGRSTQQAGLGTQLPPRPRRLVAFADAKLARNLHVIELAAIDGERAAHSERMEREHDRLMAARTKALANGLWYWPVLLPVLMTRAATREDGSTVEQVVDIKLQCDLCDMVLSASNVSQTAANHLKPGGCPNIKATSEVHVVRAHRG
jgi:hypothetical protein